MIALARVLTTYVPGRDLFVAWGGLAAYQCVLWLVSEYMPWVLV